jgi:hypothetical protein
MASIQEIIITAGSRFYELLVIPSKDTTILWTVTPLLIATVIMFVYFQRYKDEELGWNSAVANSLVSLFVSISLLKYIYFITTPGSVVNFTQHLSRTVFALLLFFTTFILLVINFGHILPKKIAYHVSSPLTINLISYIAIIFVYSTMPFGWITFIDLVIIFVLLRTALYFIQFPLVWWFKLLHRLKDQEKIKDVQKEQKKIKKEKVEIKKKEKKLKETKLKEINQEKKQLQKIKNVVTKK